MKATKQEIIQKITEFSKVHSELSAMWLDYNNGNEIEIALEKNYPYDKCFDDLSWDVLTWKESVIESLNAL